MHHKNHIFPIQCHKYKLFFINNFYTLVFKQYLRDAIRSPDKLLLYKTYVFITKSEQKHPQDHFYFDIGQLKSLLEE